MRTNEPRGTQRVRPMYGHGMATVHSRPRGDDLFLAASEEDAQRRFHLRCTAIKQYLDGSRPCPEVLEAELDGGSLLGADAFDVAQMGDGIYRRVA